MDTYDHIIPSLLMLREVWNHLLPRYMVVMEWYYRVWISCIILYHQLPARGSQHLGDGWRASRHLPASRLETICRRADWSPPTPCLRLGIGQKIRRFPDLEIWAPGTLFKTSWKFHQHLLGAFWFFALFVFFEPIFTRPHWDKRSYGPDVALRGPNWP